MRSPAYLDGLDAADLVANVAAVLERATLEDLRAGTTWYRRARREAGRLGRSLGYRGAKAYEVGAGVIAALSPSTAWVPNVAAAWRLVNEGADVLNAAAKIQSAANVTKALKIAAGAPPLEVLGGEKVRAFFRCILDPAHESAACIDRHAAAVAYGRRLSESEMSRAVAGPRFELVADAYRAVAAVFGYLPLEVQAITWVTWRRENNGTVDPVK